MYTEALMPKKLNTLAISVSVAGLTGLFVKRRLEASDQRSKEDQLNSSNSLGLVAINKKPPGLVNNGNTCFVNSVLQALASMPRFIRNLEELCGSQEARIQLKTTQSVILKRNQSSSSAPASKSPKIQENSQLICQELLNILYQLNDEGVGNSDLAFNPSDLIELLENTNDYMSFREQQDSHELLKLIINCFEDSMKAESIRKTDLVGISKKQNQLTNSLLGYTNTYLQCTACDKTFNSRNEPFYDLSLDILNPSIKTLDESLQNFFTEEFIDGVECLNCSLQKFLKEKRLVITQLNNKANKEEFKPAITLIEEQIAFARSVGERSMADTEELKTGIAQVIANQIESLNHTTSNQLKYYVQSTFGVVRRRIKKVVKIGKAPQILILHLKRLVINPRTGYPQKIDRLISFQDELVLEDSLGLKNKRNTKTTYQLSSLISHIGADNFGHYVTLRRIWHQKYQTSFSQDITEANHAKSHWYLTSDRQIRYFDKEDVFQVPAYILFYERVIK